MDCLLKKTLIIFMSLWFCLQAMAQNQDIIIGVRETEAAIKRDVIIWDVRDEKSYLEGHLPKAINVGDVLTTLRDPNKEDYLPTSQLKKIFDAAGLDFQKEVIVYGSRGSPNAYFALHMIHYFGGKQAKIFHDGIDAWKESSLLVTKDRYSLPPTSVMLEEQKQLMVSNEELLNIYSEKNLQIIDARTPDEFTGKDIRAIRGGHIPNAINIPFEENWQDPSTGIKLSKKQVSTNAGMALKTKEELQKLYAKLDPNKETIVYCQSGVRASETSTVLRNLGFKNVKVYESSWLGWGNNLQAPVAEETFLNVGALNNRISALQERIRQLEDSLKTKTN